MRCGSECAAEERECHLNRPWGVRTASFTDPAGHIWEIAQELPQPRLCHDQHYLISGGIMQQPEPGKEIPALLSSLNNQRAHVLGILEGLAGEALRRPVLPSGWTCLGLVRHLALDVERFWFRAVVAGERVDLGKGDAAWQVPPDMPAEAVFGLYRQETELANAIVAATPLDAEPAWWSEEIFPDLPPRCLRDTVLHVITETACHAGHLDIVRELIDGRTWQVLT